MCMVVAGNQTTMRQWRLLSAATALVICCLWASRQSRVLRATKIESFVSIGPARNRDRNRDDSEETLPSTRGVAVSTNDYKRPSSHDFEKMMPAIAHISKQRAVGVLEAGFRVDESNVLDEGSDFSMPGINRRVKGENLRPNDGHAVSMEAQNVPGSLDFFEEHVGLYSHKKDKQPAPEIRERAPLQSRWLETWQAENNKTCVRVEPLKDPIKMIVIVSNRRSGTHLTMDMLHNLFPGDKIVMKANHVTADSSQSTPNTSIGCVCRKWLFQRAKVIHVHRNLLDMLISYFNYRRSYSRTWRRQHPDVKRHWDSFSNGSPIMRKIVDQWVKTVHGWFTQPNVFHLRFEDVVDVKYDAFQRLSEFLDMGMNTSQDVWTRENWELVSHPVRKGKGKGKGGFKAMMDDQLQQKILRMALKNSQWQRDTLLTCPASEEHDSGFDLFQDHICVGKDGQHSLIQSRGCEMIPRGLQGSKNEQRDYFCVPDSCPRDLRKGIFFVDQEGRSTEFFRNKLPTATAQPIVNI